MSLRGLPTSGVYVAPSRVNGHGVFAGRRYRPGEVLWVLYGEEFTKAQILTGGEEHAANAYQIDDDLYVYPLNPEGRFMNHSCAPNAGMRNDREMVALREIQPGEELVFDYSTTISEKHWTMVCTCGSAHCRGVVGDFHELPRRTQQKYLRLDVVQRFIVRQVFERAVETIRQHQGTSALWARLAAEAVGIMVPDEVETSVRPAAAPEGPTTWPGLRTQWSG